MDFPIAFKPNGFADHSEGLPRSGYPGPRLSANMSPANPNGVPNLQTMSDTSRRCLKIRNLFAARHSSADDR